MGSSLLDELPLRESYSEGVSACVVQRINDMVAVGFPQQPMEGCLNNSEDVPLPSLSATLQRSSLSTRQKAARNTAKLFCIAENGQDVNDSATSVKSGFSWTSLAITILYFSMICVMLNPMTAGTNEEDNAATNYSDDEMQAAEAMIELATHPNLPAAIQSSTLIEPGFPREPTNEDVPGDMQIALYSVILLLLMALMTGGGDMVTDSSHVEDNAATSDSDDLAARALMELGYPRETSSHNQPSDRVNIAATSDSDEQILAAQALMELGYRRETRSQNQASDRVNIDEGEEHSYDLEEDKNNYTLTINAEESFREEKCILCKENVPNILFCNCGHVCICDACNALNEAIFVTCPMCRKEATIKRKI